MSDYAWLRPSTAPSTAAFLPSRGGRRAGRRRRQRRRPRAGRGLARPTPTTCSSVADRFEFVAGVVGWVRPRTTRRLQPAAGRYGRAPRSAAASATSCTTTRATTSSSLPGVRTSLSLLAEHGLVTRRARRLATAPGLRCRARRGVAGLTIVIDHLAKPPPRERRPRRCGRRRCDRVAGRPNTAAKLSGPADARASPSRARTLRPLLDIALDAFGVDRLMYGSDWPMTVPQGGYGAHWQVVSELIGELSEASRTSCSAKPPPPSTDSRVMSERPARGRGRPQGLPGRPGARQTCT